MPIQLDKERFTREIVNLIRLTSSDLPPDVVQALEMARDSEEDGSPARNVFTMILKNIDLAREKSTPICQDTGTNIYYVNLPPGISMRAIQSMIEQATVTATEKAYLRPNTVDSLTGKNTGNNLGTMAPYIHFTEWEKDVLEINLMLKGGGSENVSGQYKLPDSRLNAGRDLRGVQKCVLDAVNEAQGLGCAPGIIGVGIGGDRATSTITAKKQLFRKLHDHNPVPGLAELESELCHQLNRLGIGPMGFGGNTTVLGVKIGALHRLPASFFVSIAYMCWAYRRHTLTISDGEYSYD